MVVTEFIDDKQIRSYQATLGQEETIELSRENWLTLTNGAHQLRVEAVDGNFATSVRVWNFSKKETVIAFQFAKPEETDARATKILITPTWHIEGSVAKVEACNNAFDDSPAWGGHHGTGRDQSGLQLPQRVQDRRKVGRECPLHYHEERGL